jgi:hypothetical protein
MNSTTLGAMPVAATKKTRDKPYPPFNAKKKIRPKPDPEKHEVVKAATKIIQDNRRNYALSKYHAGFVHIVREMTLIGATGVELARLLGVCMRTIDQWQVDYPEFKHAILTARAKADEQVERALHKRALGYDRQETYMSKDGPVNITKHYPSDTNATQFWLRNRQRKAWVAEAAAQEGQQVITANDIAAALRAQANAADSTADE